MFKQEGEVAFFECVAEANPLLPDSVTWTRDNYEPFASKTKQEYKNGRSVLTVYDLERTDTGAFTCTAFNGIGEAVTELAHLIVKCKCLHTSGHNQKLRSNVSSKGVCCCGR